MSALWLLIGLALAGPEAELEAANRAWLDGDYALAAERYEALIAAGHETGDLYYNLGNALYRGDRLPESILAWRRASLLSPRDGDVRANLERARGATIDQLEPQSTTGWMFWRESLNLAEQAWGAAILLGLLLSFGAWKRARPQRALGIPAALVGAPGLLLAAGAAASLSDLQTRPGAVVLAPVVEAKSAAGEGGVVLFELHAGAEVQIQDRLGDYFQVALPDGRRGWAANSALGVVDPRKPLPWRNPRTTENTGDPQ